MVCWVLIILKIEEEIDPSAELLKFSDQIWKIYLQKLAFFFHFQIFLNRFLDLDEKIFLFFLFIFIGLLPELLLQWLLLCLSYLQAFIAF